MVVSRRGASVGTPRVSFEAHRILVGDCVAAMAQLPAESDVASRLVHASALSTLPATTLAQRCGITPEHGTLEG